MPRETFLKSLSEKEGLSPELELDAEEQILALSGIVEEVNHAPVKKANQAQLMA
ncbi:hypothetical protein O9993_21250 [Vibrio lentus]|nr:hypothetical protein [Vibrio lentus]